MLKLLRNIILPSVILLIAGAIYLDSFSHPYVDQYYWKTTTPRVDSLILGSSRAAQGIKPSVFNESRLGQFSRPISNFSFTTNLSPYGPAYFDAIKGKLKRTENKGLFILEVNPIILMKEKSNTKDDPKLFEESRLFIAGLKNFSSRPNFQYLLKYFDMPFYLMAYRKYFKDEELIVHDDGWFEVSPRPMTAAAQKEHDERNFRFNQKIFEKSDFSYVRYEYLKKTIEFLMPYGHVYLIRMPVSTAMLKMEEQFMPDFDAKIEEISKEYRIAYLNFLDERGNYEYVDIHHLWKQSSQRFTEDLLRLILDAEKKR